MGEASDDKGREPESGMLATILPGLRDLRTPLATGYMYLVLLWLWFGSQVPPTEEATGLVLRIYDIEGAFGTTALITVLTFVAYLLGSILSIGRVPSARRIIGGERGSETDGYTRVSYQRVSRTDYQLGLDKALLMTSKLRSEAVPFETAIKEMNLKHDPNGRPLYPEARLNYEMYGVELDRHIAIRIQREVPLMAVRLHASNKELFDDYDRSKAESEFRASLSLPTTLIILTIPLTLYTDPPLSIVALFTVIGVGLGSAIAYRSIIKEREAHSTIIQAMSIGAVEPPTADLIDSLVTQWEIESDRQQRRRELGEGIPPSS